MNHEMNKVAAGGDVGHFATERMPWGYRERAGALKQDLRPEKLELGAGMIRDKNRNLVRLPSVTAAEAAAALKPDPHEYLPPAGLAAFREAVTGVLFLTVSAIDLAVRDFRLGGVPNTRTLRALNGLLRREPVRRRITSEERVSQLPRS